MLVTYLISSGKRKLQRNKQEKKNTNCIFGVKVMVEESE